MDHYFQCQTNGHDKIYSVHIRQSDTNRFFVLAWSGRTGGTYIPQFKVYANLYDAESDFLKRVKSKSKTYRTVSQKTIWPTGLDPILSTNIVSDKNASIYLKNSVHVATAGSKSKNINQKTNTVIPPKTPTASKKTYSQTPQNTALTIPAWISACFIEMPLEHHAKVCDILTDFFPEQKSVILIGSQNPENNTVDWMRAIFARLPKNSRKNVYRKLSKFLHSDNGGSDASMMRWVETYNRFAI